MAQKPEFSQVYVVFWNFGCTSTWYQNVSHIFPLVFVVYIYLLWSIYILILIYTFGTCYNTWYFIFDLFCASVENNVLYLWKNVLAHFWTWYIFIFSFSWVILEEIFLEVNLVSHWFWTNGATSQAIPVETMSMKFICGIHDPKVHTRWVQVKKKCPKYISSTC